jgi:hypothetical protein
VSPWIAWKIRSTGERVARRLWDQREQLRGDVDMTLVDARQSLAATSAVAAVEPTAANPIVQTSCSTVLASQMTIFPMA